MERIGSINNDGMEFIVPVSMWKDQRKIGGTMASIHLPRRFQRVNNGLTTATATKASKAPSIGYCVDVYSISGGRRTSALLADGRK